MKKNVFIAAALVATLGLSPVCAHIATPDEVEVSVAAQDEFTAIEADQLPQAIKEAVAQKYEGLAVKAAYIKAVESVNTYKVVLADAEEKTSVEVLFNEQGEVLPAESQM